MSAIRTRRAIALLGAVLMLVSTPSHAADDARQGPLAIAVELLEKGDLDAARAAFTKALAGELGTQDRAAALIYLARIQLGQEQYAEADVTAAKAIEELGRVTESRDQAMLLALMIRFESAKALGDETLANEMRQWDLDPAEFRDNPRDVRAALQRQKRKLGPERNLVHFLDLEDGQLTDAHHFNIFPGTTITMQSPMMLGFQRAEPHPTDPNKCIFEHWRFSHAPHDGRDIVTPIGVFPFREADREVIPFGEGSMGSVSDQDLYACSGQQLGFHSRGFRNAYLADQEDRVQQFHEMLHDYMDGKLP